MVTVKTKESANPTELFLKDKSTLKKFVREICFYRLIGSNYEKDFEYLNFIQGIYESLSKQKDLIPNLCVNKLTT